MTDASVSESSRLNEDKWAFLLAAGTWLLLFLFHAIKGVGEFAVVIPDEYYYITDVRHMSFEQAGLPNYLYYLIYRLTGSFDMWFLDMGRVFNALFFMLSAPFVYMVARILCTRNMSLFLTLVAMLWPTSTYITYFMPESLYYFFFWVFAWWFLTRGYRLDPFTMGLGVGVFSAVMNLVKFHGIFLLPGFAVYMFATAPRFDFAKYARVVLLAGIGSALAFIVVRFGLGYAFAGGNGLSLFGRLYGEYAEETSVAMNLLLFLYYSVYNLFGQFLGICGILALPLAICIWLLIGGKQKNEEFVAGRRLAIFFMAFVIPIALISAGTMASLPFTMPDNIPPDQIRVVLRYYNFFFPMLIILAGAAYSRASYGGDERQRLSLRYLLLPALGLYVFLTNFRGYFYQIVPDCPEYPFILTIHGLILSAGLASCCCLVAFRSLKWGTGLYLFVFLPIYLLSVHYNDYRFLQRKSSPEDYFWPYQHTGVLVRQMIGDESSALTLVDWNAQLPKHTLVLIDDPKTDILVAPKGVFDPDKVRPDAKWLLVFGEIAIPRKMEKMTFFMVPDEMGQAHARLIRIADIDYSLHSSAGTPPWPIAQVGRDDWNMMIAYRVPLPKEFTVTVHGASLPPLEIQTKATSPIPLAAASDGQGQSGLIVGDGKISEILIRSMNGEPIGKDVDVIVKPGRGK